MMRPLVMDFRTDVRAQNIGDEFLFGPAILVAPVTEQSARTRHLYLPGATWVDFWTGKTAAGGDAIDTPAPVDHLPLYIRAGSILPLGPDLEYAGERVPDPVEIRVYRGASGSFTLYEDENDNYNYERGVHATISFTWDDSADSLTIGDRVGTYPGMVQDRTFKIVFVREGRGIGGGLTDPADKTILYSGKKTVVIP